MLEKTNTKKIKNSKVFKIKKFCKSTSTFILKNYLVILYHIFYSYNHSTKFKMINYNIKN